jgi:hypothetical protein
MSAKHTQGPVHVDAIGQIFVDGLGPQPRICMADSPAGKREWDKTVTAEESKANAALIADAFNVATESGMTPRQLASAHKAALLEIDMRVGGYQEQVAKLEAQRAELLAAFKRLMDICGEGGRKGRAIDLIDRHEWERASAAIAKATGAA